MSNVTPPSATESITANVAHRKIIEFICNRNMDYIKQCPYGSNSSIPNRTKNHPSPTKQSGSNRYPGQPATRAPVDKAIQHELAEARFTADDLADQMFGHLVPTDLAKYILGKLVSTGDVQVYEGDELPDGKDPKPALDSDSQGVLRALDAASEDTKRHACLHSKSGEVETGLPQEGEKQTKGKDKGKEKKKKERVNSYLWRWRDFPAKPINEDELVEFLNTIIDQAFEFAKPQLDVDSRRNNRFAAPRDKRHAVPLPYEADSEDMRPDFLVLPIEAFLDDLKTVDERYVNFTTPRVVGESKSTDFGSGLAQVHRYARGIRRAQPWEHFVIAMTVTSGRAALLRGEGSGTERLELILSSGRGCIEFIRILLGLALAQGEDLGQNPDVELGKKEVSCRVASPKPTTARPAVAPCLESSATSSTKLKIGLSDQLTSTNHPPPSGSRGPSHTYNDFHPSDHRSSVTKSSTSKRSYAEVDHSVCDEEQSNPPKRQKVAHVNRMAFVPIIVYGHTCIGILFTSSSIRGRGTTVFCVVDCDDESRLLALKMFWQDLEREEEQNEVLERLKNNKSHPNVVVPVKTFRASRKGKTCTTLEAIRGLRNEELSGFPVENRVLTINISELKRPVKYFWGVHDFVRGLRGALLGHEYLTKIGILHRDISENNIVLARRLGEERGYLIDFDMATLQRPEDKPAQITRCKIRDDFDSFVKSSSPIPVDESKPLKALRTGTTPYMSFNVLRGGMHTYYDDIESFLYVLLLFFFSYAGPLSKQELLDADAQGFVHPLGSGRLAHTRRWSKTYTFWAEGDMDLVASSKDAALNMENGARRLIRSAEVKECIDKNWSGEELQRGILILLAECWQMFIDSRRSSDAGLLSLRHTKVSHGEFIGLLDWWLAEFTDLEDKYSRCPFY